MMLLAVTLGLLLEHTRAALPQAPVPSDPLPRLLVYSSRLNLVEETRSVALPRGRSVVRVDFVRQNAELTTLDVRPLDHPDTVRVVAQTGRSDLPGTLFIEIHSDASRVERFRFTYAARGVDCRLHYRFTINSAAKTLDLVQELAATNASGETFEKVALATVFGDVKTVPTNAVLHGRSPDPKADAKPGLPAQPLWQDLAEHTSVSFGTPVRLPDGVTVSRRTLEKPGVPFTVEYRLDSNAGGLVSRTLKVVNKTGEGLGGITLQPGAYTLAEREADRPELALRGGSLAHLPAGKDLELDAGAARDMAVKRELLDTKRSDLVFGEYNRALLTYTLEEVRRVEVRNRSDETRAVQFLEHISGTDRFEVINPSLPVSKKTRDTVELRGEVPAWGTLELRYTVKKTAVKA